MKKQNVIQQLLCVVTLLGVSLSSFAGSCDQQQVNVLLQKAYIYNQPIAAAAMRYRVNPALIKAVITAESCFRNDASSNKGAGGLMQLMPATAQRFGVYDRFDPYQNIDGGTRYLRWLLNRYGGSLPHAIAAYNAGEGRVDYYGAAVPIQETAVYTRRVLNAYSKLASNGRNAQAYRASYNRGQGVQPHPVLIGYRPIPQRAPAPKPEARFQWDEFASN